MFKNFTESKSYKTDYSSSDIFGGKLIGITGTDFVTFYDWETFSVVRRIETLPKAIYWSDSGAFVILALEDSFYLMRYNEEET